MDEKSLQKILDWLVTYAEKIFLCLLVLIGFLLIIVILKLVSLKIKKRVNEKAKKITMIIYSLIKYLLLIFTLFIMLAIWDFDTTIGVILFAIVVFVLCLSAIPYIQDLYSGISNAFSSNYKVGDIVSINGFNGKVVTFTLVKTQVQGNSGEIKTFMNGSIKEITNYSVDYLTVSVKLNITELNRIDEIKKIIDETLHEVNDEYTMIVEGPNLVGLDSFKDGVASIKIEAKVKAEDYQKVMKGLQEYLLRITVKYGIK